MELNETEQQRLETFIDEIASLEYIIPRGFQELPNSVTGDLDIVTSSPLDAKKMAEALGFRKKKSNTDIKFEIITKGLKNPLKASKFILNDPKRAAKFLTTNDTFNSFDSSFQEYKLYNNNLMIHIQNKVVHKSTLDNSRIPTDPRIEESLLKNRRSKIVNGREYYIPSLPDELIHLVGRGVFDYNGDFPSYYKKRCYTIWNKMSTKDRKKFSQLSEHLFFKANNIVINHLEDKTLENLRHNLLQFSNY